MRDRAEDGFLWVFQVSHTELCLDMLCSISQQYQNFLTVSTILKICLNHDIYRYCWVCLINLFHLHQRDWDVRHQHWHDISPVWLAAVELIHNISIVRKMRSWEVASHCFIISLFSLWGEYQVIPTKKHKDETKSWVTGLFDFVKSSPEITNLILISCISWHIWL